jgi:hypothetical protein
LTEFAGRDLDWLRCDEATSSLAVGVRAEPGNDVVELEGRRLFKLGVGAWSGFSIGAPAIELGGVAEPVTFHVVVADLDHPLGPQRHEGEILASIPTGGFILRGVRSPASWAAQFHWWPSKLVTSDCISLNNCRCLAIGNAPITPTEARRPSSV